MVLLVGGLVVGYLAFLGSSFDEKSQTFATAFPDEQNRPEKATGQGGREPLNILLLGADSGGGSGESEQLPDVPQSGRADTMMWVHIPGDRENVYVMSVMRDLWVEIPGQGEHKVNAAYSFGGVPTAVQTLESMFDSRIDHVVAVDLAGFEGLVDALDGVQIDNPQAFTSRGDIEFAAGPQQMDGPTALAFVRERYAFSDGDYTRVRNQQLFLRSVTQEVLDPGTLANPTRTSAMVDEISPYLTVDETLDAAELARIGATLTGVRSGDIEMFTVPTAGVGRAGAQSVVWPDWEAIGEIGTAMSEDELSSVIDVAQ